VFPPLSISVYSRICFISLQSRAHLLRRESALVARALLRKTQSKDGFEYLISGMGRGRRI